VIERVLITADAVGGVWRYTVDLGRELTARGIQVTVAVMGPSPGARQRLEAADAGLAIVDAPYRLEWMDDPWEDVELAGAWLLELEQRLNPGLVHLNGYAHAALPWRSPLVVVAHSCVRSWWRAVHGKRAPYTLTRYSAAVAAGLRAAHVVVAPTRAMGEALRAEYGVPAEVSVIPNGCRRAGTTTAPPVPKEPLIFAAGRTWDEAKNIQTLCAIADALAWPVYVAGEHTSPDGQTSDLGAVRALGQLDAAELAGWYCCASIYALPARYEPFGLTVLEAAAAECALVLGDIPSLRENWDGAAVFVPAGDREALAAALGRLIDRPEERLDLARRARTRADTFSIDRTADEYLRLYQALAA
jgi:glycosyltransferase involved in cell wall biosynthesis